MRSQMMLEKSCFCGNVDKLKMDTILKHDAVSDGTRMKIYGDLLAKSKNGKLPFRHMT